MNFKYDEELYGKTIYEKGFQTDFIKSELTILVKYLKQIKKLNKKDTEKFLYEFCQKYIVGFNKVQYFKTVDSAIRNGRKEKNKLIVVKDIPILKSELECIEEINIDNEYKKLLLSFLVNKKISLEVHKLIDGEVEMSGYFGGNNIRYREIFKSANIIGKYKIDDMVNKLVQDKVISSIVKGDIVLDYMYLIYPTRDEEIIKYNKETGKDEKIIRKHIIYKKPKDEDVFITIKNFENIGYVFDYYKGINKIKKCEKCGELIKATTGNNMYCKECAKEIKKEQDKIADKKYKEKLKSEKADIAL